MNDTNIKNVKGRPRKFDKNLAIAKATQIFCEFGFERTSISMLTKIMNINSPSLYNAFKDKEGLFIEVIKSYHDQFYAKIENILFQEKNCIKSILQLVEFCADFYTLKSVSLGCLVANSAIEVRKDKTNISKAIKDIHKKNEHLFYKRLELGQKEKNISNQLNIKAISQYINCFLDGMALHARSQNNKETIKNLALVGRDSIKHLLS